MTQDTHEELRQKLNLETGKIRWEELQILFARGVVVAVAPTEDLVEIAASLAHDQAGQIETLIQSGALKRAMDDDASRWHHKGQLFWSVVVAPWVLVQEINET